MKVLKQPVAEVACHGFAFGKVTHIGHDRTHDSQPENKGNAKPVEARPGKAGRAVFGKRRRREIAGNKKEHGHDEKFAQQHHIVAQRARGRIDHNPLIREKRQIGHRGMQHHHQGHDEHARIINEIDAVALLRDRHAAFREK